MKDIMTMDMTPSFPMNAIRHKYLDTLAVQRDGILRLSAMSAPPEDLAGLRIYAHRLAGTGKIYGFPEISEAGYALECTLRDENAAPEDVGRKTRYLLSVIERAIKSGTARTARGQEPEADGLDEAAAHIGSIANPGLSKPVLLVIDDDPGITDLVLSLFDQVAHVTICQDVATGLSAAADLRPHLVMLDEQMPGGRSGLDLLQQLRDMPVTANVPVIMMSADDSLTSIMRALVSGATDYLIKPFEPVVLMTKAQDLLRTYRTKILIVDDDPAVRDLLEYKLGNAGCNAVAVGDCHEAWALLEKGEFSLVLLDRMMPDLDGAILLRMMHGSDATSRIPVVFLTACRSPADVVDGLLTGATDYITKPFDADDVVRRCLALVKAKKH